MRCPDQTLTLVVAADLPICHKVAIVAIAKGASVRKYGEVIGRASAVIAVGAWVHVHNLASNRARHD